jgi:hypothetical protein
MAEKKDAKKTDTGTGTGIVANMVATQGVQMLDKDGNVVVHGMTKPKGPSIWEQIEAGINE